MLPITLTLPGIGPMGLDDLVKDLVVLGCLLAAPGWIRRTEGIAIRTTLLALLIITVGEFVVGHAHVIFATWFWTGYFEGWHSLLMLWPINASGAMVGAIAGMLLSRRVLGFPLGRFADGITPIAGLGIAGARLGCFLRGCCYGAMCDHAWCLTFPPGSAPQRYHAELKLVAADAFSRPIHPLQLYFLAVGLAITGLALYLRPRRRYEGQVGLVVLLVFAVTSALLDEFRQPWPGRLGIGPLSHTQCVWIAVAAATSLALVVVGRRHRTVVMPIQGVPA